MPVAPQPIPAPKATNRLPLAIAVVAIVAVLAIAGALVMLNPASQSGQKKNQVVHDGDFIVYTLSGTSGGAPLSGIATMAFTNVAADACTMTATSTSPAYTPFSGTFLCNTSNGIWTSQALTGMVLDNPGLKTGQQSVQSNYGTKTCDVYHLVAMSLTIDYYVAVGSGIPYKLILSGQTGSITMTLTNTNMEWVKSL